MCVYLVAYEPESPEQEEQDSKKIRAYFDATSVIRLFPGIWLVISGPSPGSFLGTFLQILGYSPRCLVSSISESSALHLTGGDYELAAQLRGILPHQVQIW